MNPKLNKRFPYARTSEAGTLSIGGENNNSRFTKTSVRDQAVLLLSIADIAKTEINNDGLSVMWVGDEDIPKFPKLSEPHASDFKWLTPRTETLKDLIVGAMNTSSDHYPSNRVRSVSIEYSPEQHSSRFERTTSPLSLGPPEGSSANLVSPGVSPLTNRRLPFRKQSLRLSHKARKEHLLSAASPMCSDEEEEEEEEGPARTVSFADTNSKKSKPLQPATAKGVIVKKILRKKFSWKNYPEVRHFSRERYYASPSLSYLIFHSRNSLSCDPQYCSSKPF
jgi:hypothetical protein